MLILVSLNLARVKKKIVVKIALSRDTMDSIEMSSSLLLVSYKEGQKSVSYNYCKVLPTARNNAEKIFKVLICILLWNNLTWSWNHTHVKFNPIEIEPTFVRWYLEPREVIIDLTLMNYTHLILHSAIDSTWIPQYNTYSHKWIDKDRWYNTPLCYMTPSLVDSSQISTKHSHCSTTCRNLELHEVCNTRHAQCCEGYDRLNDKVPIDSILLDSSSSCEF